MFADALVAAGAEATDVKVKGEATSRVITRLMNQVILFGKYMRQVFKHIKHRVLLALVALARLKSNLR
ncbi:hypothetical protein ACNKHK_08090 [Shigella flexneri]